MAIKRMSNENIGQVSGGFRAAPIPEGFSRVEMKDCYTPNEYLNMHYVDTISGMHAANDLTGEKKASDHMHGKYMPDFARTSIGNMGKVVNEYDGKKSKYYTEANYDSAAGYLSGNPTQFGS